MLPAMDKGSVKLSEAAELEHAVEQVAARRDRLLASLTLASCATTAPGYGTTNSGYYPPASSNTTSCYDCGTVTRIEVTSAGTTSGVPNATGAVLGGIVGAVAGREISDQTGGSKGNKSTGDSTIVLSVTKTF